MFGTFSPRNVLIAVTVHIFLIACWSLEIALDHWAYLILILVLVKEGSKCSSFSDEETAGGGGG